jgi:hypothetical protein
VLRGNRQQSRDGAAWLINNRLHELELDAACSLLAKLAAECAKDKWGKLPPPVKSAVVKVSRGQQNEILLVSKCGATADSGAYCMTGCQVSCGDTANHWRPSPTSTRGHRQHGEVVDG